MISMDANDPASVAGAAVLCAWMYLAFKRGGFWKMRTPLPPRMPLGSDTRTVAAVIPARDEAATIGSAVASLLDQNYAGDLRIIVIDDNSADGTASAAGGDERLTVLSGKPLPPGWTGKLFAVSQGLEYAKRFSPDYILLTDADVYHDRNNVRGLVARAEAQELDLVSLMVRLHCASLPEKLLIPAFVFFFFKLYPPAFVNDRRSDTAAAAGGCMLVRTSALDRIGGIESIRNELIDDCALAAAVKRARGDIFLGLGDLTVSAREYHRWSEIWNMIARTAFTQLRYSPLLLIGTVLGMVFLYAVPVALSLVGHPLAMAAWVLLTVLYLPAVLYFELSPLWAPLLPIAAAFYLAATVASAVRYWRGEGGQWKGRAQAPPPAVG